MIEILNIRKINLDEESYLYADIMIPPEAALKWEKLSLNAKEFNDYSYISLDYQNWVNGVKSVYYKVDKRYEDGLCDKVGDAFIVGMLYYAMATEEDIHCKIPVSNDLLFNLNHGLLPYLCIASNKRTIQVTAEKFNEKIRYKQYVCTGMSGGVDSFHTLYEYNQPELDGDYKLTHLTYFNVGADRWYLKDRKKMQELDSDNIMLDQIRKNRIKKAKDIAVISDLDLIAIDSNISDIYQGLFEVSHIYRSASAALALQNYISKYYISSSGCSLDDFTPSIYSDPAHYEQLLIPMLSNQNLTFISSGKPYTRLEKFRQLSNFDLARNNIIVCSHEKHCYSCNKEYRSIVIMDILDCIQDFHNVFDTEKIKDVKWKAYFWLLREHKKKNPSSYYLYLEAKKQKKIPLKSYLRYYIHVLLKLFRR